MRSNNTLFQIYLRLTRAQKKHLGYMLEHNERLQPEKTQIRALHDALTKYGPLNNAQLRTVWPDVAKVKSLDQVKRQLLLKVRRQVLLTSKDPWDELKMAEADVRRLLDWGILDSLPELAVEGLNLALGLEAYDSCKFFLHALESVSHQIEMDDIISRKEIADTYHKVARSHVSKVTAELYYSEARQAYSGKNTERALQLLSLLSEAGSQEQVCKTADFIRMRAVYLCHFTLQDWQSGTSVLGELVATLESEVASLVFDSRLLLSEYLVQWGQLALKVGEHESCKVALRKLRVFAEKNNDAHTRIQYFRLLIAFHLKRDDPKGAKKAVEQALSELQGTNEDKRPAIPPVLFSSFALFYFERKDWSEANGQMVQYIVKGDPKGDALLCAYLVRVLSCFHLNQFKAVGEIAKEGISAMGKSRMGAFELSFFTLLSSFSDKSTTPDVQSRMKTAAPMLLESLNQEGYKLLDNTLHLRDWLSSFNG